MAENNLKIKEYIEVIEKVAKVEQRRIPSHMIEYEELVSIGLIAVQTLIKDKTQEELKFLRDNIFDYIANFASGISDNEKMNIAPKTVEMLKLIPEGGNFTSIPKDSPLYVKGMISHVYRRIKLDEPSRTIIAAGGGGTWGYHYPEPRPLTNRERARLQSFPDNFIFEGSNAEVRRQIGNAVPPKGVEAVARALMPLFEEDYNIIDLNKLKDELSTMSVKDRLEYRRNRKDLLTKV